MEALVTTMLPAARPGRRFETAILVFICEHDPERTKPKTSISQVWFKVGRSKLRVEGEKRDEDSLLFLCYIKQTCGRLRHVHY